MSARSRRGATASLLGAIAILALAASPVLAKEGAEARLDTIVHRDAQPGSTVTIGFSVYQISADKQYPIYGSPIYLRLVGPDKAATEIPGLEAPFGSGHYLATLPVPRGGIQDVIVFMQGEACYDDGHCQQADYTFPLTDDSHVVGYPVGIAAPKVPAEPAAVTSTASGSVSNGLLPLIALGVAFALGGGLTAFVVTRRRPVAIEPTLR